MDIVTRAVVPLKLVLATLFAVLLLLQTVSLPGQFAHLAEESPDQAHLRWPLTALGVFWVLCVQVVIVSTWRLLRLVQDDRIFSDESFAWVDVILGAIAAAWTVLVGVLVAVGLQADDPAPIIVLFLVATVVAAVGLLMLVMRSLLRQATGLRTDLDAVI